MPLYTIKLSRNKASVGSLGPYATRRAAAIDALTLVLNSGVPRSGVEELGKKDRRSKGERSIDGGPRKRFAVGYKYQPSGYIGDKPDGTSVEARIVANKKGEMPKANPRRNGRKHNPRVAKPRKAKWVIKKWHGGGAGKAELLIPPPRGSSNAPDLLFTVLPQYSMSRGRWWTVLDYRYGFGKTRGDVQSLQEGIDLANALMAS